MVSHADRTAIKSTSQEPEQFERVKATVDPDF